MQAASILINNLKLFTDFSGITSSDFDKVFVPEVFSSLIVIFIIIILCIFISIKFKKALKNPLEKPKGFILIITLFVSFIEKLTVDTMGKRNKNFSGYIMGIALYVFIAFIFGLTGLAAPMTYLGVPLSIALCTFILIHATAIKENHRGYFKRFIDPIPVFLPINLISMWAPLLSLTLRMFGNAVSGFCIMSIVYFGLENISNAIFGGAFLGQYWANALGATVSGANGPAGIFLPPIITPILHAYFDLFSGFIQTTVFVLLTMIFVVQEQNEQPDQVVDTVSLKG